mmetsp:Transcript_27358/g.41357  ORF Transcript_27358/g.41357 Transcript_27358/m.41357 type:complete len:81 (+) Transcript_27358:44-286(+)
MGGEQIDERIQHHLRGANNGHKQPKLTQSIYLATAGVLRLGSGRATKLAKARPGERVERACFPLASGFADADGSSSNEIR